LDASQKYKEKKSEGAVAALDNAWRSSTNNANERRILISSRKLAIDMIRRYGSQDATVYPLLERSYRNAADMEEQFLVVAALAALATDDSARILSAFLNDLGVRRDRGTINADDERRVRTIIPALGETGRPAARQALQLVLQQPLWPNAIHNMAREALGRLPS
jgi:hypothetical protein